MPNDNIFSQRLTYARRSLRDLSQEELANKSGMKPAAISHFETGARKPSFDNLRKLAEVLDVTTDFLTGRSDDPEGFKDVNMAFRDGLKGLSSDQRKMVNDFAEMLRKQTKK